MGMIEFEAERKHMGSPLVVVYDEVSGTLAEKSSIMLSRKRFKEKEHPKRIKVTVEWLDD